jgi:hypothetical protein
MQMQRTTSEEVLPELSASVESVWDEEEPPDQTPPPDHED